MLRWVDANGNLHQVALGQIDETSCGSNSILMARLMTDPIYAMQFTAGNPTDDSTTPGPSWTTPTRAASSPRCGPP
jgi:hypothetical protein